MKYHYKSPIIWLKEVSSLIDLQGKDAIVSGSKYRKERELYIGSLFSLGITSHTGQYSWLREPDSDPPDVELMHVEKIPSGNVRVVQNVEIVEFQKYSSKDIYQTLEDKLNNAYPNNWILLCYIHKRKQVLFPQQIHDHIVKLNPKILAVYILSQIDNKRNSALIEVWPKLIRVDYNFVNIANEWPETTPHCTGMIRGT